MTTITQTPHHRTPLLKRISIGIGVILVLALAILYFLSYGYLTNSGLTFSNKLHIPPLLQPIEQDGQKIFELTVQHGQTEFFEGVPSETMGFNGNYLGPTIRVAKGDNVVINVSNQLDEPTATHWHGMHVPPEMDGTPHQMIAAGDTWQARYPILNEAATMWYHPHPHGTTAQQVYRGLVGLYIIDDENSRSLALPNQYGIDDIPVVVQDRLFDSMGATDYALSNGAYYGDEIVVNGTLDPFVEVPTGLVRLRLLNGSNARIYYFGFEDGRQFHQIASDGGLLDAPVPMTTLKLATGERAEIVVDLSDGREALLKSFPGGDLLILAEAAVTPNVGNGHFEILKLVPTDMVGMVSAELPQTLNQIKRWQADEAVNRRIIRLAGGLDQGQPNVGGGGRAIPINGKLMDMTRIDETITLGDIEIWEIHNAGGQPHPFHIHDIQFLILDRNGVPPMAGESGWKDTVLVDPDETVRFITQFTTYADPNTPFMFHCHILEHEDRGMMGQFIVVDPNAAQDNNQSIAATNDLFTSRPLLAGNSFLNSDPFSCAIPASQ